MKKLLVERMMERGMTREAAGKAHDVVFGAVQELVREGTYVRIPGIGGLHRRPRAAFRRRIPHTGEMVSIAGYDVVVLANPRKF